MVSVPTKFSANKIIVKRTNENIKSEIKQITITMDNVSIKIDSMLGALALAPRYKEILEDYKEKICIFRRFFSSLGELFTKSYFDVVRKYGEFSEKLYQILRNFENKLEEIQKHMELINESIVSMAKKQKTVVSKIEEIVSSGSTFLAKCSTVLDSMHVIGSFLSKILEYSPIKDDTERYNILHKINRFSDFFKNAKNDFEKFQNIHNRKRENAKIRNRFLANYPTIREPEDLYSRFKKENVIKNSIAIRGLVDNNMTEAISFNLFNPNLHKLSKYQIFIGKYKEKKYKEKKYQIAVCLGNNIFEMDNQLKKEYDKRGNCTSTSEEVSDMNKQQIEINNIIDALNQEFIKNDFDIDKMYKELEKDYHKKIQVIFKEENEKEQNEERRASFYILDDNINYAKIDSNGKIKCRKNIASAGFGSYPIEFEFHKSDLNNHSANINSGDMRSSKKNQV